jgi:hypothetical protein
MPEVLSVPDFSHLNYTAKPSYFSGYRPDPYLEERAKFGIPNNQVVNRAVLNSYQGGWNRAARSMNNFGVNFVSGALLSGTATAYTLDREGMFNDPTVEWAHNFRDKNIKKIHTDPNNYMTWSRIWQGIGETGTTAGIMVETLLETALITAVTQGTGLSVQAANITAKAGKLGRIMTSAGAFSSAWAVKSRYNESMIESVDAYKADFHHFRHNLGYSEEKSVEAALESAKIVFQYNLAYMPLDIITAVGIPFASAFAKTGSNIMTKGLRAIGVPRKVTNVAVPIIKISEEGFEEGYQSLSQDFGRQKAELLLGRRKKDDLNFFKSFGTEEFKDAVLTGLIGGVLFKGIGIYSDASSEISANRAKKRFEKRLDQDLLSEAFLTSGMLQGTAEYGEEVDLNKIKQDFVKSKVLGALADGKKHNNTKEFDNYIDTLKDIKNKLEKNDAESLKEYNIDITDKDNQLKQVNQYLEDVQTVQKDFKQVVAEHTGWFKSPMDPKDIVTKVKLQYFIKDYNNILEGLKKEKQQLQQELLGNNKLGNKVSGIASEVYQRQTSIAALESLKKNNQVLDAQQHNLNNLIDLKTKELKALYEADVRTKEVVTQEEAVIRGLKLNSKLFNIEKKSAQTELHLNEANMQYPLYSDKAFLFGNKRELIKKEIREAQTEQELAEVTAKYKSQEELWTSDLQDDVDKKAGTVLSEKNKNIYDIHNLSTIQHILTDAIKKVELELDTLDSKNKRKQYKKALNKKKQFVKRLKQVRLDLTKAFVKSIELQSSDVETESQLTEAETKSQLTEAETESQLTEAETESQFAEDDNEAYQPKEKTAEEKKYNTRNSELNRLFGEKLIGVLDIEGREFEIYNKKKNIFERFFNFQPLIADAISKNKEGRLLIKLKNSKGQIQSFTGNIAEQLQFEILALSIIEIEKLKQQEIDVLEKSVSVEIITRVINKATRLLESEEGLTLQMVEKELASIDDIFRKIQIVYNTNKKRKAVNSSIKKLRIKSKQFNNLKIKLNDIHKKSTEPPKAKTKAATPVVKKQKSETSQSDINKLPDPTSEIVEEEVKLLEDEAYEEEEYFEEEEAPNLEEEETRNLEEVYFPSSIELESVEDFQETEIPLVNNEATNENQSEEGDVEALYEDNRKSAIATLAYSSLYNYNKDFNNNLTLSEFLNSFKGFGITLTEEEIAIATAWYEKDRQRAQELDDLINNPDTVLEGIELSFSIDFELLNILPEFRAQKEFIQKLQENVKFTEEELSDSVFRETMGHIPVQVSFVYDGIHYKSYIHTSSFPIESMQAAAEPYTILYGNNKEALLGNPVAFSNFIIDFKTELYQYIFSEGKTFKSIITSQLPGYIQYLDPNDKTVKEPISLDKVYHGTELLEKQDIYIVQDNKFVALNTLDEKEIMFSRIQEGGVYLKIPMANGKSFMHRLHISEINIEEAEIIWEAYKQIAEKKHKHNLQISINGKTTSNITPKDLLNLLVYHQNFTTPVLQANHKTLQYVIQDDKGYLLFGTTGKLSEEQLLKGEGKEEFIEWIQANKLRQVSSAKLGKNLNQSFTLNGQNYFADQNYIEEFLLGVLKSFVYNTKPQQSTVHYNNDLRFNKEDYFNGETASEEVSPDIGSVEWFKNNLPQIPLHIIRRIRRLARNQVAYGAFIQSLSTIDRFGKTYGVDLYLGRTDAAYHEAIHPLVQLLLNESERILLFESLKKKFGDKPLSELEEDMAELHRTWKLKEDESAPKNIIEKLFKYIQKIIDGLLNNRPYYEKVFSNLSKGVYATRTISPEHIDKQFTQFMVSKNPFTDKYIDSLSSLIFADADVLSNNKLYINVGRLVKKIKLERANYINSLPERLKKEQVFKELQIKKQEEFNKRDEYILYNPKDFESLIIKRLEQKLKIVLIESTDSVEKAELADDTKTELFGTTAYNLSYKGLMSIPAKLMLSSLKKKSKFGQTLIDQQFLLPKVVDFNNIYNFLINNITKVSNKTKTYSLINPLSGKTDILQIQLEQLQKLSAIKPELKELVNKLKKYDENEDTRYLATQFSAGLNLVKNQFYDMFYNRNDATYYARLINTDSVTKKILNEFHSNLIATHSYLKNETRILNSEKLLDIITKFEILKQTINLRKNSTSFDIDKTIGKLTGHLQKLGLPITDEMLKFHIERTRTNLRYTNQYVNHRDVLAFTNSIRRLLVGNKLNSKNNSSIAGLLYLQQNDIDKLYKDDNIHFVTSETELKELAISMSEFRDELLENVSNIANKSYWDYNHPTYMQVLIENFKRDPKLVEEMLNDPLNKDSVYLKQFLQKENLQQAEIADLSSVTGDVSKNIKDVEQGSLAVMLLNNILNERRGYINGKKVANHKSKFRIGSQAEANRAHIALIGPNLVNYNPLNNYAEMKFVFAKYLFGEMTRAVVLNSNSNKYEYVTENLTKMQLFPEISQNYTGKKYKTVKAKVRKKFLELNGENHDFAAIQLLTEIPELHQYLNDKFSEIIRKEADAFVEYGLFEINDKKKTVITESVIDKTVLAYYKDTYPTHNPKVRAFTEFALNAFIANYETHKLFDGDIVFYKNMNDYSRKSKNKASTGTPNRIRGIEDKYFGVISVKDSISASTTITENYITEQLVPIYQRQLELFLQEQGIKVTDENIKAVLNKTNSSYQKLTLKEALQKELFKTYFGKSNNSGYKQINRTDAFAITTPARFRQYVRTQGLNISKETLQKLEDGTATIAELNQVALHPIKGAYFARVKENGIFIPKHLKYTVLPLYPQLVNGTAMESLLFDIQAIEKEFGNPIEIVTETGFKVGNRDIQNLFNGRTINPLKIDDLNIIHKFDNVHWRLQTQHTNKYDSTREVRFSSQFRKNIKAVIIDDRQYGDSSGAEIKTLIDMLERELSDRGQYHFQQSFYDNKGNIDNVKLNTVLIKLLKERAGEIDQQLIASLENGASPSSLFQFKTALQYVLGAELLDKTVKINMPGGAFLHIPSMLLSEAIKLDADTGRLPGGTILFEKKTNRSHLKNNNLKPGSILLPHKLVEHIDPEILQYGDKELILKYIDSELLKNMIIYRIPNQPINSIDVVDIVGILPKQYGDSIGIYDEMTTQMGVDMDGDKTYVLMPSYKVTNLDTKLYDSKVFKLLNAAGLSVEEGEYFQTKKITYVKYEDDLSVRENSKKAIYNKLLESYVKIISDELFHLNSTKPLDSEAYKAHLQKINNITKTEGTAFWTNANQLFLTAQNLASVGGIGLASNIATALPANRNANMSIKVKLGVGNQTKDGYIDLTKHFNTDGTLIFEVLNDLMNLYFEDAKDPTTAAANINMKTFNVLSLFHLSGERLIGENLLATPMIKKYIQQQRINIDDLTGSEFYAIDETIGKKYEVADLIAKYKDKFGTNYKFNEVEQAEMLYLWNELIKYGNEVTTMTLSSKQDAVGFGKNMNNAIVNLEGIRAVLKLDTVEFAEFIEDVKNGNLRTTYNNDNQIIINFAQKFNNTSLGTYLKNSTIQYAEIVGKVYPMYSQDALDTAREVGVLLGNEYLNRPKLVNTIFKHIHAFQNSKSPFGMITKESIQDMFIGENAIANIFQKLNIRSKRTVPAIFEDTAIGRVFKIKNDKEFSFLYINEAEMNSELKSQLELELKSLFNNINNDISEYSFFSLRKRKLMTKTEIKLLKSFSKQLIFYAQYSSGFNPSSNAIFKVLPTAINSWKLGAGKSYTEYINSLNMSKNFLREFPKRFIQHNSNLLTRAKPIQVSKDLILVSANNEKHLIRINEAIQIFKPYLSYNENSYKFVGKRVTEKGGIRAIYKQLETRGYNHKGFTIYEYNEENTAFNRNKVVEKSNMKLTPTDSAVINYVPIETTEETVKPKDVKTGTSTTTTKGENITSNMKALKEAYTNQKTIKDKVQGFQLSIDKKGKDQGKADLANAFIGYGNKGTSTYVYSIDAQKNNIPVNNAITLDSNTIAFVSVNGDNKSSQNTLNVTVSRAKGVLENGGTIIMDSTFDANRNWNKSGEAIVQKALGKPSGQTSKGYNYWGGNPETVKTKRGVVIKPVSNYSSWAKAKKDFLKDKKDDTAIGKTTFWTMRPQSVSINKNKHFGNPFSSTKRGLVKDVIVVDTTEEAVHLYKTWLEGKVSNGKSINVYYRQAETANSTKTLSNLAYRPFRYNNKEYGSVEHAYQVLKSGTLDKQVDKKYQTIGGYGIKFRGKGTISEMKAANNLNLMQDLVVESFLQNKNTKAAIKLLQYEIFTHNSNNKIDKAFLDGLKLAQQKLLNSINPQQKSWILEQINSGVLNGKKPIYYKPTNYKSHADVLVDKIQETTKSIQPFSKEYGITLEEWNNSTIEVQAMIKFQHKNC